MKSIIIVLLALLLVGAAQAQQPSTLITDQPFRGVLFQPERAEPEELESLSYGVFETVEGVWAASVEDVLSLEASLKPALTARGDNSYAKEALEHYNDFKRQYIGVIVEGHKYIFATYDRSSELSLEDVTKTFRAILPEDGGSYYMEVFFNPETDTLVWLNIHRG